MFGVFAKLIYFKSGFKYAQWVIDILEVRLERGGNRDTRINNMANTTERITFCLLFIF